MPERLPLPPGPYRYVYKDVTREIGRYIAKSPRGTKKDLAAATGMDHTAFAHRMAGRYRFSFEQIGAIAEAAKAPPGWPWLPWVEAEAFAAFRQLLANSQKKEH